MAFRGGLSIIDADRGQVSLRVSDLPDDVRRRHARVEHDRMLYREAADAEPALRDLGDHLSGARYEPQVIRDLIAIAKHRGWPRVEVWGGPGYRRELWYEAKVMGIEVANYAPSPAEVAELDARRRRAAAERPADLSGPDAALARATRPGPVPRRARDGEKSDRPPRSPDAASLNLLSPSGEARSVSVGDVPARLMRRYLLDPRDGPGMGFYADARSERAAFRDHGARLSTDRSDPSVIRDLVDIASHRGWGAIQVRGQSDFRREVWMVAREAGLEVRGYRPTSRDLQDLARRTPRDPIAAHPAAWVPGRVPAPYNTVEAVVRQRVAEPDAQARILAGARARIATWLERRAALDPAPGSGRSGAARHERVR